MGTLNVRDGICSHISRVQTPTGRTLMRSKRIWLPEEDKTIVYLRNQGRGWLAISKHLNERSPTACRLRYQNYLERWDTWDDYSKTQLAQQYLKHKSELWLKVAKQMTVPPRAAEGMFWELAEKEIASRAGIVHPSRLKHSPLSVEFSSKRISINGILKRSDLINHNVKSTTQLPSLREVLSTLSQCSMVTELPAMQYSFA
ncbi:uncharacterized protein N7506_000278 [Penicillium brevicompactum]|uniref:uncharacterized protein n=1 Tax=Penicillium brevicompactum TaxID=5074 RepID=UPI00254180B9|nr:uncharacterized protein N7506_000278 [Penicillium brevicompactum]KAJ5347025.1 hypothetical protein N7506_000278 [Penicillium brevicompactum]